MKLKKMWLAFFAAFGFLQIKAQLTQTNLPIVIISTANAIADTQVLGSFRIVNNSSGLNHPGDAPAFQGNIGVKYRGSAGFPKRSYNIETWTNIQKVSLDTSLLGMPSENDWVLLACYTDRSFIRNLLAFHLWEQMGYYAPRMRLVEVVINNSYKGVYLFGEKIKRDANRIDIANLKTTDVAAPQITGGYIFRIDNSSDGYWKSNINPPAASYGQSIRFHYEEPADNDITPVQKSYIKSYTDSFEAALQATDFQDTSLGWRRFAGHNSFEDYLVINEVMKSRDAYRQATYLYKDKSKKLRVGPVWDQELSLYNTQDCNASRDTGWAFLHSAGCPSDSFLAPFWWSRLVTDSAYVRDVKCKYTHWRDPNGALDTVKMFSYMDSVATLLQAEQAVTRNFTQWPTFGVPLVNEPLPLSANYADEVQKLKAYLRKRFQFLDGKWLTPGCILAMPEVQSDITSFRVFPNPVADVINVSVALSKVSSLEITVSDVAGRIVVRETKLKANAGTHQIVLPASGLANGFYIVTARATGRTLTSKFIKN